MNRKAVVFVLSSFLIWRTVLFLIAAAACYLISTFGARFPYYDRVLTITGLPNWIWGFGNFDGVHYLRIAQDGYSAQYSQAFFPLYPVLTKLFSFLFPRDIGINTALFVDPAYFFSGLLLSNMLFLAALLVFYKLLRIDYSEKVVQLSILLLLIFPTSFYFGAIYTESLFLLLTVLSLYFLRKKYFLFAGFVIALASMTKVIGILLILVYLIEFNKSKNWKLSNILGFLISPLGLLGYMFYLHRSFGNSLYFLTSQPVFGAGRDASGMVLPPQVIFRYIKIFTSVSADSLPYLNAVLELVFTILPFVLLIYFFKKMRKSYWVFTFAALLLPTLTGTLSSMPRYALAAFLLLPLIVQRWNRYYKLISFVFIILGVLLLGLFIRGYWIA